MRLMDWLRRIPRLRQARTDRVAPMINHLDRLTEDNMRRIAEIDPMWEALTVRARKQRRA